MKREQLLALHESSKAYELASDIEARMTGSTLDARALKFIGSLIQTVHPIHWMEFGSGLSTLFTARLLSENPQALLYTVDHSDYYLGQTQEMCHEYDNIVYLHAPIAPYQYKHKDFLTYSNSFAAGIPQNVRFDVVLIDGPLGFRYGREAPLYQIAPYLKPDTIIVLDDAEREPEQRAIANWRRVWRDNISMEFFPGVKGLAVIQVHDPALVRRFPFNVFESWKSWWHVQETLKLEGSRISPLYTGISYLLSKWQRARWKYQEIRSKLRD